MRDNIFESATQMPTFEFNQTVTGVFDDMINRSVPFYKQILTQVAQLVGPQANIYDLGCSTGALVPYLNELYAEFNYVGIDKSPTMIQKARQYEASNIQFLEGDLAAGVELNNPSAIVCNLVLQFIQPEKREALIKTYLDALPNGGRLIIVEKVRQQNPQLQAIYKESYHDLKRANGYSQQEIDNKDAALAGVLISETSQFYWNALSNAGATTIDTFFKWYNFEGMIAIK